MPNVALPVKEILAFVRRSAQEKEIGEVERLLLCMVMEVGDYLLGRLWPRRRTDRWARKSSIPEGIDDRMREVDA